MLSIKDIRKMASEQEWSEIAFQENIGMVSFIKGGQRINVYLTTGTVATAIDHPKKGKTQLYRKKLSVSQIKEIFLNTRTHTGKGYYTKA